MAKRMSMMAVMALFLTGLTGLTAAAAGRRGPNILPWDQAAKIARETGKPVACYSVVDSNGGKPWGISTVNADWSINECVKLKECGEFIWTRCDSVKTARLLKVSGEPPQMYILDCDMEKVHSCQLSDLDSVEAALQAGLEKYSGREITWQDYSEDDIKAATEKRFAVLAFTNEREDCKITMKAFEDRSMVKLQGSILFQQAAFVKDSEEAKRWGVATSPAWLIIDPNQNAKVLERLQGRHTVNEIRAFLAKGLRQSAGKKLDRGATKP